MASTTLLLVPTPPASRTLIGTIFGPFHGPKSGGALGKLATPDTPRPLLERAAREPATWVPCELSSCGVLSLPTKSQPWTSSTLPLASSSIPLLSLPPPLSPGLV